MICYQLTKFPHKLKVFESAGELAETFVPILEESLDIGLCCLAGGETPKKVYEEIGKRGQVKSPLRFLLTDDRLVPDNHKKSNFGMVCSKLGNKYDFGFTLSYYSELEKSNKLTLEKQVDHILNVSNPQLCLLGLGTDAHTASLFPGNSAILDEEVNTIILKNNEDDFERFSLGFKALLKFQKIVFLVVGENKSTALYKTLFNCYKPLNLPAQKILKDHCNVEIWSDESAAEKCLNELNKKLM